MSPSPAAPVAEATLETLEAAFALPSVEPRPRGRVAHPIRRDPDAALVADSARVSMDLAERCALALFAAVACGAAALIASSILS